MRRQEESGRLIEARNEGGRELLRLRPQSRTRSLSHLHDNALSYNLVCHPSPVLSLEKPLISTVLLILDITRLNNYLVTKSTPISSQR